MNLVREQRMRGDRTVSGLAINSTHTQFREGVYYFHLRDRKVEFEVVEISVRSNAKQ
jgi:hypothetical protein